MPFFAGTAPPANSMSDRLRQLTATHGFDGTKWKFGAVADHRDAVACRS